MNIILLLDTKNHATKQMSLEEFLQNDTLGDSVWNEDDINLDAINKPQELGRNKLGHDNTINADRDTSISKPRLLTHKAAVNPESVNENDSNEKRTVHVEPVISDEPIEIDGPPYMIKFSNLPPKFSDFEIPDLFHAKHTNLVKFKMFWELEKCPSIATLKNGTVFDQNFKRSSKVAFVEVFSFSDAEGILRFWSHPLKELYKIHLEPAKFDDFKQYMQSHQLIKSPNDDPNKSYIATNAGNDNINNKKTHLDKRSTINKNPKVNNNNVNQPKQEVKKEQEFVDNNRDNNDIEKAKEDANAQRAFTYSQVAQRGEEARKTPSASPMTTPTYSKASLHLSPNQISKDTSLLLDRPIVENDSPITADEILSSNETNDTNLNTSGYVRTGDYSRNNNYNQNRNYNNYGKGMKSNDNNNHSSYHNNYDHSGSYNNRGYKSNNRQNNYNKGSSYNNGNYHYNKSSYSSDYHNKYKKDDFYGTSRDSDSSSLNEDDTDGSSSSLFSFKPASTFLDSGSNKRSYRGGQRIRNNNGPNGRGGHYNNGNNIRSGF